MQEKLEIFYCSFPEKKRAVNNFLFHFLGGGGYHQLQTGSLGFPIYGGPPCPWQLWPFGHGYGLEMDL